MALGLTQPLTEMSTRNISWGHRRPVCRADKLTIFMCRLAWNLGASTSWNPQGLSRPVMGLLYLFYMPYFTVYCCLLHPFHIGFTFFLILVYVSWIIPVYFMYVLFFAASYCVCLLPTAPFAPAQARQAVDARSNILTYYTVGNTSCRYIAANFNCVLCMK